MKKYLRFANLLTLVAGAAGMLLMAWLYGSGTDQRGLYQANHPAWILLGILTVAVVMGAWLLARQAGTSRNYRQNFPPSILSAIGCVVAAIGLAYGSLQALEEKSVLSMLTGLFGILGGAGLLWGAACRFRGQRSKFPIHTLPCFFFALQLFLLGQEFGSEPEMYRYLYRFWALLTMVPACYWLWSFDVNLGKRTTCLFWCLVAAYCNLVAVIGMGVGLLHGCTALWMLTNLPRLRYLPKQSRPAPEPAPVAPAEEIISTEETAEAELPVAEGLTVELPDPDVILEELLRDFSTQENP